MFEGRHLQSSRLSTTSRFKRAMSPRHVIEYSGKPDGASDNGPKVRNVSKRAHGDVQLLWDPRGNGNGFSRRSRGYDQAD